MYFKDEEVINVNIAITITWKAVFLALGHLIAIMSFNLWTIITAQRARKEIGNLHYNKKKPNKICINEIQCHNIGPFLDNPRSSSTPTPSLSGFSCLVGN